MTRHLWWSLAATALLAAPAPAIFLGRSAQAWAHDLSSSRPEVRRNAAFALGKMGREAGPALRGLRNLLNDAEAPVREAAANALGELFRDSFAFSDPALAGLLAGLLDD